MFNLKKNLATLDKLKLWAYSVKAIHIDRDAAAHTFNSSSSRLEFRRIS